MKSPLGVGGIFLQLDGLQRQLDPLRQTLKAFDDIARQMKVVTPQFAIEGAMQSLLKKMQGPLDGIERIFTPLRREQEVWDGLLSSFSKTTLAQTSAMEAALSWGSGVESLVGRFSAVGMFDQKDDLVARLLAPASAFTLAVGSLQIASGGAEDGLEFLCEHWTKSAATLEAVVALPEDDEEPGEERELVLLRSNADAASSAIDKEIAVRARTLLTLAHQCNTAAQARNTPCIFKATTRLLEVYADLPWLRADSQRALGDFVDCLYFLFYEGAGKDSLRFRPVLADQECGLVWRIKHLRNKWLRHDLEHGAEKEIKRSYASLAEALKGAGLDFVPTSAGDFLALQRRLLGDAEEFLLILLERLQKPHQG